MSFRQFWMVAIIMLFAADTGAAGPVSAPNDAPRVAGLKCEFAVEPAGIDVPDPRLSWRLEGGERGQRQTAYRIIVASKPEILATDVGDLWDTGKIDSDQTTFIRYAGKPLKSSQLVFWKVRAWDSDGRETAWSPQSTWIMGILDPAEWKGAWVCAPAETESLLLRREITVKPGLRRAIAHVSGLGQYELNVNGTKAGNELLSPGWTGYGKTILYDTRDLTHQLREGNNALGMILGNGMYHVVRRNRFAKFTGSFGPLKAILHLRLEYDNDTVDFIGTDEDWRIHPGPITYNSIYGGEDHDARLEPRGWDSPGFDDSAWPPAVRQVRPGGQLRGHSAGAPPVRAIETRPFKQIRQLADGSVIYDLGQNASFMPRLRVTGPAGSTVRLTPAEVLNDDGTLNRNTMGSPSRGLNWWQYTKSTDNEETWFPRFFYIGSRYLQADLLSPNGAGQRPRIEALEGAIVHSASAPAGEFESSSEQLNRTRDLIRWAMRSNMMSVLTDCPHREKLGWLEQNHFNGPGLRYEFDVAQLFAKNVRDMADAQLPTGLVPNIAPEYTEFKGTFRAAAEWGAAFIAVPWQQYLFTGDVDLLRQHYEAMRRYFAYLESRAENHVLSEGLGDWYDLGPKKPSGAQLTPPPVTATAMYLQDARLLAQIAKAIDRDDDAADFNRKAEQIRQAALSRFFDADAGTYGTDSQTSLAIALDIVDPEHRPRLLERLIRKLEENEYGTTCGNVGFRFLLRALADAGRHDVVHRVITQDKRPGYGWQLARGETSLTESWDANLGSSHNHFMFGQATEWFYRDLAGIDVDPAAPGFKKVLIRPNPPGDLRWVKATYDSIHGPIAVRWEHHAGRFTLNVTIPPNTTATVSVPAKTNTEVNAPEGATPRDREGERAIFSINSGDYIFESSW